VVGCRCDRRPRRADGGVRKVEIARSLGQMATLIQGRYTVADTLGDVVRADHQRRFNDAAVRGSRARVNRGQLVADARDRAPKLFDECSLSMVARRRRSRHLDEGVTRRADFLEVAAAHVHDPARDDLSVVMVVVGTGSMAV